MASGISAQHPHLFHTTSQHHHIFSSILIHIHHSRYFHQHNISSSTTFPLVSTSRSIVLFTGYRRAPSSFIHRPHLLFASSQSRSIFSGCIVIAEQTVASSLDHPNCLSSAELCISSQRSSPQERVREEELYHHIKLQVSD